MSETIISRANRSSRRKKSQPAIPGTFLFIVQTDPRSSVSPDVRQLIRRQAMQKAGTERKARGGYGKHNLVQFPFPQTMAEDKSEGDNSSPNSAGPASVSERFNTQSSASVVREPPRTSQDILSRKQNVSLLSEQEETSRTAAIPMSQIAAPTHTQKSPV
ncbi:hypothetical protein B0O99DRAFT_137325 [Bisporella sp. PMI_857]|nr:hypothetical protein B0O99DRAFT_137325 [Bisporella sp. PMI_857]